MSFLAPFFLLGAIGIAVPVLLHLRRRKSKERFAFPSLMFLEEVPHATIRRRRLRDLLLLALRSLAVLLLVLAFAQPALRARLGGGEVGGTELFFLIDRSASMGIGERWSRAIQAVEERLSQAADGDVFHLALFDDTVEVAASAVGEPRSVSNALGEVSPRDRATSLSTGLRVLRPLLLDIVNSNTTTRTPELVVISDFQSNGTADIGDLELPPGTELVLADVSAGAAAISNRWIQRIELERVGDAGAESSSASREQYRVIATVARDAGEDLAESSGGPPPTVPVELWIDGRVVQTKELELSSRSAAVAFDPISLETGRTGRGEVRLPSDAFAADDHYYFTASAAEALDVVLVGDDRRNQQVFVKRALETSDEPRYRVSPYPARDLTSSRLQDARVVVVPDVGELNASEAEALRGFVESGGGLLVGYSRASTQRTMPSWLDLRSSAEVTQTRSGVRLARVAENHPVFASLRGADWSAAPFFRYFPLKEATEEPSGNEADGPSADIIRVLARFDDGSSAIVERTLGAGRIVAMGSSLDSDWNDFPRQAVFLAWIDQTMRYLSQYTPVETYYTVGAPSVVEVASSVSSEWLLVHDDGEATPYTLDGDTFGSERNANRRDQSSNRNPQGGTLDELLIVFEKAGYSSLRPPGQNQDSGVAFAANLDRRESELRPGDIAVLEAQLTPVAEESEVSAAGIDADTPTTSFWWLVLYAALALLVSEGVVASRIRRSNLATALNPS